MVEVDSMRGSKKRPVVSEEDSDEGEEEDLVLQGPCEAEEGKGTRKDEEEEEEPEEEEKEEEEQEEEEEKEEEEEEEEEEAEPQEKEDPEEQNEEDKELEEAWKAFGEDASNDEEDDEEDDREEAAPPPVPRATCPHCSLSLKKGSLKVHLERVHDLGPKFTCPCCQSFTVSFSCCSCCLI